MRAVIWITCLAVAVGLTVPVSTALLLVTVVAPTAYQLVLASCSVVEDEAGLPTPVRSPAAADAASLDCASVSGALPPGPDGACPPSGSTAERGLKHNTLHALRCIKQRFPWINYMGGVGSRPSGYVSDHPRGLAVDFMVPAWNTRAGNARGWEVARWLQAHAKELHVKYLIYNDRSWRAYNPSAGWRPYRYPGPNPGGASQRHLNHVHMSVYS